MYLMTLRTSSVHSTALTRFVSPTHLPYLYGTSTAAVHAACMRLEMLVWSFDHWKVECVARVVLRCGMRLEWGWFRAESLGSRSLSPLTRSIHTAVGSYGALPHSELYRTASAQQRRRQARRTGKEKYSVTSFLFHHREDYITLHYTYTVCRNHNSTEQSFAPICVSAFPLAPRACVLLVSVIATYADRR